MCNFVKLKPGGIIELLLKAVTHTAQLRTCRHERSSRIVAKHARTGCSIFSNSSIILPGLRASIGVTRSYFSRPFLCALGFDQYKASSAKLGDHMFYVNGVFYMVMMQHYRTY